MWYEYVPVYVHEGPQMAFWKSCCIDPLWSIHNMACNQALVRYAIDTRQVTIQALSKSFPTVLRPMSSGMVDQPKLFTRVRHNRLAILHILMLSSTVGMLKRRISESISMQMLSIIDILIILYWLILNNSKYVLYWTWVFCIER